MSLESTSSGLEDDSFRKSREALSYKNVFEIVRRFAEIIKDRTSTEEQNTSETRIVPEPQEKESMNDRSISAILEEDPLLRKIVHKTGARGSFNETTAYPTGPEARDAIKEDILSTDVELKACMYSWANDASGLDVSAYIKELLEKKGGEVPVYVQVDRLASFFVGTMPHALLSRGRVLLKILPKALWNCVTLGIWPWTLVKVYSILKNTKNFERLSPREQRKLSTLVGRLVSDAFLLAENAPLTELRNAGANVQLSDSELSTQEHSKIFLMKSKGKRVVYTGGRNIGDEYLQPEQWKDHTIRAEGPIADEVDRQIFGASDDYDSVPIEGEYPRTEQDVPVWSLRNFSGPRPEGCDSAEHKQVTHAMLALIEGAETSIDIEHAYLMNMKIVRALVRAAKRGVVITILRTQPEQSNIEAANEEHFGKLKALYRKWKDHRREKKFESSDAIVELQSPHVLHSKLMIVDSRYVLVGSANMTTDSLRHHGEHAFLMLLEEGQPKDSAPQILKRALDASVVEAKGNFPRPE